MIQDQIITAVVTVIGIVSSFGFYPQAWRIFRHKSAVDVSIPTFLLFGVGNASWLLYGLYKNDVAITASFLFGTIGSWLVVLLALYYRHKKAE